jgi:putative transposase
LFIRTLSEVRDKLQFLLVGYVAMPDHVHLIVSEPPGKSVSTTMQILKQRTSRAITPTPEFRDNPQIWQTRFYDFNIYSEPKLREKLRYIHLNPVKEKLVVNPMDWGWSSFAFYETGKHGLVRIDVVD